MFEKIISTVLCILSCSDGASDLDHDPTKRKRHIGKVAVPFFRRQQSCSSSSPFLRHDHILSGVHFALLQKGTQDLQGFEQHDYLP